MGLIDKVTANKSASTNNAPTQDQLSVQELEFLLLLIKQSTFRGESVEIVYNTALKLQSQHSKQTK